MRRKRKRSYRVTKGQLLKDIREAMKGCRIVGYTFKQTADSMEWPTTERLRHYVYTGRIQVHFEIELFSKKLLEANDERSKRGTRKARRRR